MADSSAPHPDRSSRWCQAIESQPPGRRTRAHSRTATSASNQCHAWKTVTASAVPSGNGIASAPPRWLRSRAAVAGDSVPREASSASSMPSEGSTASTSCPSVASTRDPLPVPHPRSTTVSAVPGSGAPSIQVTVSPGHSGRTAS